MLSFSQYLVENLKHPHFISTKPSMDLEGNPIEGGMSSHYSGNLSIPGTQDIHTVSSAFHTNEDTPGVAYWGFTVGETDAPVQRPDGISDEAWRAHKDNINDTSIDHIMDFVKKNPEIHTITYQTRDTEAGRRNHERFQSLYAPRLAKLGVNLLNNTL
jgi:hypothetical protein